MRLCETLRSRIKWLWKSMRWTPSDCRGNSRRLKKRTACYLRVKHRFVCLSARVCLSVCLSVYVGFYVYVNVSSGSQLEQEAEGWKERLSELEEEKRMNETSHNRMMENCVNKDEHIKVLLCLSLSRFSREMIHLYYWCLLEVHSPRSPPLPLSLSLFLSL